VYGTEKTPAEWSREIKNKMKGYNITLKDIAWVQADTKMFDPGDDGTISIRDQFIREDDQWHILKKANKDRIGGWENMQSWLTDAPDGIPYWQVSSLCTNLIRTLPELVHDEHKVEDVDTDGEDHAGDDQRYMLKKLKWIDAGKLGAISHTQPQTPRQRLAPQFIDGKQVGMNLDLWSDPQKNDRGIGGIVRS